ncbi:MAG: pilus assembly protein PilM [Synergistaceae bacterium]|nr:pilus assembly protein PilM [Synergistaceae bacterium]
MPIKFHFGHTKVLTNFAGLAIHDDALYFQELDDDEKPVRSINIPLEEGCVVNGSIRNLDMLESAFEKLHKEAGRINEPVSIGIPSHDAVIRPLNLPRMSLDDVKSTLNLNFDEYFPFSGSEAVFDALIIKTPNDSEDSDNITVLTAAAKISLIERLLDISRKTNIPAGAVEPLIFAMTRTAPEAQEGLSVFASAHAIVTTWNGDGIYFRAANNTRGIQDITSTVQYIENQYRRVRVSHLVLAGLNFQLNSTDAMNVINMTDKFFASRGLAMRNRSPIPALDLRPSEYVELERRRYAFNPTRLAMWMMLAGFFMLSSGTIGYSVTRIRELITDIDDMRDNVSVLTQRRMRLAEENSRLEKLKNKTEKIIDFLQSDMPVLEVMNALESSAGTGIKFDNADFSRNLTIVTVVIDGKAQDEQSVINLTEGLKSSGLFSRVMLPVSQKDQTKRIIFKLVLTVRKAEA